MVSKNTVVENPEIGKCYHLSWAKSGCVWRLLEFTGAGEAHMITPRTKKHIIAKTCDFRYTNKQIEYINHIKNKS